MSEEAAAGGLPLRVHPEWRERLPWLVQGTTWSGEGEEPFDLGLFGEQPVGRALGHWRALREELGVPAAVHARQVHGGEVREHTAALPAGLSVMEGFDGHLTSLPGLLLAVSVADCVPVSLVDPGRRAIALRAAIAGRLAAAGVSSHSITVSAHCTRCGEGGYFSHRGGSPARQMGLLAVRA